MFKVVPSNELPSGIENLLNKTKGNLFYKKGAGFLGPLLAKVNIRWSREVSTACIGNRIMFWNPDFFMSLDPDSRVTVLAHELWHNAFNHGSRLNSRNPDDWNKAGDYVINNMLEEQGYYMGGFPYLLDKQFNGMSTDEVYDIIVQKGIPNRPNGTWSMSHDIMPMTAEEAAETLSDVVSAMTVARMTGKAGEIPGEISLTIENFLHPKLPWETILFNFFNAMTSEEYSFSRPNRRYSDPLMPGLTGRNGLEHLIYYLDISGSITDDHVLRFNSEVKFIQEQLKPERLTLVTFDTQIHDTYEFERDDPFEKIVVIGRGGTDLDEVFEHMQEHRPTAAIIFTDLEVDIPADPGIPIIWVCIENAHMTVPYGELIHVDG